MQVGIQVPAILVLGAVFYKVLTLVLNQRLDADRRREERIADALEEILRRVRG